MFKTFVRLFSGHASYIHTCIVYGNIHVDFVYDDGTLCTKLYFRRFIKPCCIYSEV